jgi:hypothetical protein
MMNLRFLGHPAVFKALYLGSQTSWIGDFIRPAKKCRRIETTRNPGSSAVDANYMTPL